MTSTKTLLILLGPTGVGKTDLSIGLAQRYGSPIISADSRQMYAGLTIGTAAPTAEQLAAVEHHFVGHLQPDDYYSAARYERDALALMERLFESHDLLVLTGGSMMYLDAVCKGMDEIPTIDTATREHLSQRYAAEGLAPLCDELHLVDPDYYKIVDLKNPKRVIHALEVYYMTGRTFTSFRTNQVKPRPFRIIKIGLTRPREELYQRINRRVDEMMAAGLLEETRLLLPFRDCNALNTVGYKEMFQHIDGEWELPYAVEKIKQNSRNYARRQMTWFRRDSAIQWFHPDETENILTHIASHL